MTICAGSSKRHMPSGNKSTLGTAHKTAQRPNRGTDVGLALRPCKGGTHAEALGREVETLDLGGLRVFA